MNTPTQQMAASRKPAYLVAEDAALRLELRAKALRIIADLAREHLLTGSEAEGLVWRFLCDLRD